MLWVEYYWIAVFVAVVGVLLLCGLAKEKCNLCNRKRRLMDMDAHMIFGNICKHGCGHQKFIYTKGYKTDDR